MRFETKTLGEVIDTFIDYRGKTPKKTKSGIPLITAKIVKNGFIEKPTEFISEDNYDAWMKRGIPCYGDVVLTTEAPLGQVAQIKTNKKIALAQRIITLRGRSGVLDNSYLKYYLQSTKGQAELRSRSTGSTVSGIKNSELRKIQISFPSFALQKKIASILSSLDDKIELNNKINDNLQQQVMTLYRQMFVENTNDVRRECRADEYFDISIGKTPPRKEPQWFSENPVDHVWVSISDMGSCGLFIAKSSEYLTHEAVERFNVKVVPDNTVLLSFKLTVGRIAITDGEMTTNEAIAHFKTNKPEINEYLFCYLKNFNYQTMGSTSSIATAVNSKIIKGMPFVVPTDDELEAFHGFAEPIFAMIKRNQRENTQLTTLRNTLLAKLMSGEIDVSGIQL